MWVCFLHKSEIVKVSQQLTDHIIKSGYNIQDWKVKYWCGSKLDLVGDELDQVMSMWGRTRWEQTRYQTKPTATGCQTQLNTIYWIESDWVWLSSSSNSHKVRSSIWFDCQTQWNSIHGLSLLEFDLQTFNWLCWNNFICNSVLIRCLWRNLLALFSLTFTRLHTITIPKHPSVIDIMRKTFLC